MTMGGADVPSHGDGGIEVKAHRDGGASSNRSDDATRRAREAGGSPSAARGPHRTREPVADKKHHRISLRYVRPFLAKAIGAGDAAGFDHRAEREVPDIRGRTMHCGSE